MVRADGGLYVIFTGPAMRDQRAPGGVSGKLAQVGINKIEAKRDKKISAVEAKLTEVGPAAMAKTKNSMFIPADAIQSLEITDTYSPSLEATIPYVIVKANKKLKLRFAGATAEQVAELFGPLAR